MLRVSKGISIQPRPSQNIVDSTYSIRKDYDCLDFVPVENELMEEGMSSLRHSTEMWSTVFFVGSSIGFLGALMSITLEYILIAKLKLLSSLLKESFFLAYFYWCLTLIVPTALCAALIIYIEPNARGLGLARVIGFLNGIEIHDFESLRVAAVKYIAILLTCTAGLPGGRVESFIHFGAVFSGSLSHLKIPFTNYRPFLTFSDPNSRRDLVTTGAVAATAVAFGAPVGAVLFCLEEGITFWNSRLTFIMFICTVVGSYSLHFFRTIIIHGANPKGPLNYYIFFSGIDIIQLTFKYQEIYIFVLFGIIGAVIGSIWNKCFLLWHTFRKRFVTTNMREFIEAIIYGLVIFTLSVMLLIWTKHECTPHYEDNSPITESKEVNVYCKEGSFQSIAIFLFQDLRYSLKSLVRIKKHDIVSNSVLFWGICYNLVMSLFQSSTILPSGIIIPHLIIGASWGLIAARWLLPSDEKSLLRSKYAFLGALAQASGAAHFTLSLGIIMIESSGQKQYAFPVFITVLVAKWFGSVLSEPIYRTVMYLNGYPFIRTSLLPMSSMYNASDIMATPIINLPIIISARELLKVLREDYHKNYPILADKKIIGVVSTNHILTLLETRTFQFPQNDYELNKLAKLFKSNEGRQFRKLKKDIVTQKYSIDIGVKLDFQLILNKYPYTVHQSMPLRRVYSLFLSLGNEYVYVVDDKCDTIGVITRKDVARFRRVEKFLLVKTEVVPIN